MLLLLIAAAAWAFWPAQRPDLANLLSLGERYDVRILRDTWGLPHIFGLTDADAAFGLAYAHSEDDFLTIQQVFLAARGLLGSVYGPDAAPNDYMVALLRIRDVVDDEYERQLAPESRALLQGYADGLNFYAALHPDEVLSPDLFPLSGKDIAAGSVHRSPLFFGLDRTLGSLFEDTRPAEISAAPSGWRAPDPERGYRARTGLGGVNGSNVFAVAPSHTTDGSTFLAVNSHQPWEGPVTWYEAHVHSDEGLDMTGALFPGSPVIIQGHNRDLGWSFTVNDPDLIDVYVLEINPDDENEYRFDGAWRELETGQAHLRVRILGNRVITVKREILWSAYGPTVRTDHGVYAVRYAGAGRVDIFEQLYRMNRAADFEAWQAAMQEGSLPMFNVGYADREGNIYYLYNGLIPERPPGWEWDKFLPGNTSANLWTGTLPFELLPQILNPSSGFIQNANSSPFQTTRFGNPDPADFAPSLGIETYLTNRALRLLELLGRPEPLSFDDFAAVKWDRAYSVDSDIPRYIEQVRRASFDEPALIEGQEILSGWDLVMDPDSPGPSLMVMTLYRLNDLYRPFRPSQMVGLDVPDEILLESYAWAVDHLLANFGRVDVPWGEVNRLVRGDLSLPIGGGPDIVHAVYGILQEDGTLRGVDGDGVVYLVRWAPDGTVESFGIHQYGSATLDPGSPHYADQALLFVERQLRPVWFEEEDILANLEAAYRPGEED